MEKISKIIKGVRFYILLKEKDLKSAEKKAIKIGKKIKHPYKKSSKTEFEFIGLEHLLECFSSPSNGAMLSVFKDKGSQWSDALDFVRPSSEFEIETFRYSTVGHYLARLVYFVKNSVNAKTGKITTCQVLFRATKKEKVLPKIYQIAVEKQTLKNAVKVRRDCGKNAIAEFVGIEDVIPVFENIKDGMELNRTVEQFKTRNDLLKLI